MLNCTFLIVVKLNLTVLKAVTLNLTVLPHFHKSKFEPRGSQSIDVESHGSPALL